MSLCSQKRLGYKENSRHGNLSSKASEPYFEHGLLRSVNFNTCMFLKSSLQFGKALLSVWECLLHGIEQIRNECDKIVKLLGPVIQSVDNFILQKNHYPLDSEICLSRLVKTTGLRVTVILWIVFTTLWTTGCNVLHLTQTYHYKLWLELMFYSLAEFSPVLPPSSSIFFTQLQ